MDRDAGTGNGARGSRVENQRAESNFFLVRGIMHEGWADLVRWYYFFDSANVDNLCAYAILEMFES